MTGKTISTLDGWIGKALDQVCRELGNPDLIEPASYYSAKFTGGQPSVVLTYRSSRHRWYISETGIVIGVIEIKE